MLESSESLQLRMSELREKINTFGNDDDMLNTALRKWTLLRWNTDSLNPATAPQSFEESEELESTPTGDMDSEGRESRALERKILKSRNYVASAVNDYPLDWQGS